MGVNLRFRRLYMPALMCFLFLIGSLASFAIAQIQFPVERPNPKIGEIWKYRVTDLWTGNIRGTYEAELIAVEENHRVFLSTTFSSPNKKGKFLESLDNNTCRVLRGDPTLICAGFNVFPLQIGTTHEYKKQPYEQGYGYNQAQCEAKAEERITVHAGTFDTVRIECDGFWNNVFENPRSGQFKNTYWYAPAVKREAKFVSISYRSNGALDGRWMWELADYITK